jgi:hypothetical protein
MGVLTYGSHGHYTDAAVYAGQQSGHTATAKAQIPIVAVVKIGLKIRKIVFH